MEYIESTNLDIKHKLLSINWNKIYYDFYNKNVDCNKIFNSYDNIDSIVLVDETNEEGVYTMKVVEKDWTVSNYCWNWSLWVLNFLWKDKVYFLVNGKKVEINKKWDDIYSQFVIEDNIEVMEENWIINNIDDFLEFKNNFSSSIGNIFKFYSKNYKEIYKIFSNDKKYATYISHLMSYIDEKDFFDWINNVEIQWLVSSNTEPSLVIKYKWVLNMRLWIYAKLLSFLVMYSFKNWNYIFPKSVNVMLVDKSNTIFPFERGVLNWIDFSNTVSCWTWSIAVSHLNWDWRYFSSQKNVINTKTIWDSIYLIAKTENIFELDNNNENSTNFYWEILVEQINYVLDYFNVDNLCKLTNKIVEKIWDKKLLQIKEKLWTFIFNSWWHENEFPIDPYKISTYLNQKYIWNKLNIDQKLVYLDTMKTRERDLKYYPNVSLWKNKPKIVKNILSTIKESDSVDEVIEHFKKNYGKLYFSESLSINLAVETVLKSFPFLNETEAKNIIWLIKNSHNTKILTLWFYKFFISRMKEKWKKLKLYSDKREKLVFKWYQDYFLSIYTKNTFPELSNKLLNNKIKLLSESKLIKLIKEAIVIIYQSPKLRELLENYFKINIENKWWKPLEFGLFYNGKKIYVDNYLWQIVYKIWKSENYITWDSKDFSEYLQDITTLNWVIMLFVLYLTWQLQIGSERWYRTYFIQSINMLNDGRFNDLKKYLELTYLTTDYEDGISEPDKVLWWTDYTFTKNIFLSVLLWEKFTALEINSFLSNYMFPEKLDKNKLYKMLSLSFENDIKNKIDYLNNLKLKKSKEMLDVVDDTKLSEDIKKINRSIWFLEKVVLEWINDKNIKTLVKILSN